MIKKKSEIHDLLIAWIAISFCFAIVIGNYSLIAYITNKFSFTLKEFFINFGVSLIVTATSFIAHEMAHKYTGIHFGAQARFVLWLPFLLIGVFLAGIFGIIFIAPGAVYIYGKTNSVKENGITSLAGPVTNIVMAFLFFIGLLLGLPTIIISYGLIINLWIAFFNLIPFGPLDGAKIIRWNPFVWVVMITIPVISMFALGIF